MQSCEFKS